MIILIIDDHNHNNNNSTANLRTKILEFGGFDSSNI